MHSRFPSNQDRKQEWLTHLKRGDWKPKKGSRVCSDHFEDHFINRRGTYATLRFDAVPTRFQKESNEQQVNHEQIDELIY